MGWKHVLCVETLLCAAVGTASHQRGLEACNVCVETLLCAAVGTARHQNGLEEFIVYGDTTVCSCRHSKSSEWVTSMYCVYMCVNVCGRSGTVLKNDKADPNLSAFNLPTYIVKIS